jgi:hypothetical protein
MHPLRRHLDWRIEADEDLDLLSAAGCRYWEKCTGSTIWRHRTIQGPLQGCCAPMPPGAQGGSVIARDAAPAPGHL